MARRSFSRPSLSPRPPIATLTNLDAAGGARDRGFRRDRRLSCRRRSQDFRRIHDLHRNPTAATTAELLKQITHAPLIRCDQVQFRFLGISLAGWNAILSLGGAALILLLTLKPTRR